MEFLFLAIVIGVLVLVYLYRGKSLFVIKGRK